MKDTRKALLIIDMQKGSFIPKTPRYDTVGVVERINQISTMFRKNNFPVIHIQHDGTRFGDFIPKTKEWEILDAINFSPNDLRIDKYANDVFYQSYLHDVLQSKSINHLYITGCATDFCVNASVQSALVKDYHVTIVEDGHTTGERPHMSAEKVIGHYNWIWQNMIPTEGQINVVSTSEILKQNA